MKVIRPKPVHSLEIHKRYIKHKHSLSNIVNSPPNLITNNATQQLKKIHQRSVSYHHQQERHQIDQQNCKIIQRLFDIATRKKSKVNQDQTPKIIQYKNPARKKREKCITEMNNQLAQRIITKRSQFDHREMLKGIAQYQKIKKTLYNNKKAVSPQFHDRYLPRAERSLTREFYQFRQGNQSKVEETQQREQQREYCDTFVSSL